MIEDDPEPEEPAYVSQPGWDDVEALTHQQMPDDDEWLTANDCQVLSSIRVLEKYRNYDPLPTLNRLTSIPSQNLLVSYNDQFFRITLDSGA